MSNTDAASVEANVELPEEIARALIAYRKAQWEYGKRCALSDGSSDSADTAALYRHLVHVIHDATPTVAPTPAGDMAGEDDGAPRGWGSLNLEELRERHAMIDRAYLKALSKQVDLEMQLEEAHKSARREPVAGDGWQRNLRSRDEFIVSKGLWPEFCAQLPAAQSPVPSDTGGEELVSLDDCPIGLFESGGGELCLKTEYSNNEGRIDAYIVSTGEFFWGGAFDAKEQRAVKVRPVESLPSAAPTPGAGSGGEPVALLREEIIDAAQFYGAFDVVAIADRVVERLKTAPPTSVDAVAVVTEEMEDAALGVCDDNGMSFIGRDTIHELLLAALRAAQQSGEAS